MSSFPLYIYIHHIFIHSSVDGHIDYLRILVIINSAARNVGTHVSFWSSVFVFLRYIPRVELLGRIVVLFLVFFFSETSVLFSIVSASIYIPINGVCILTSICYLWSFDDSLSDRCEVIPHCGLDLHCPDDEWWWVPFHVYAGHLHVLFGKMSNQVFCPSVWIFFFMLSYMNYLYILKVNSLSFANIFSHLVDCLFVSSTVIFDVQR